MAECIAALADAEMVTPRGANGDREYVFKHPLTQEVAYGSQLSERRARAHEAVAAAIERIYPDSLDERAALLAHHCEAAGEKLEAARWHARAAAWAELTSPADGMRHWRRVRELTTELEATSRGRGAGDQGADRNPRAGLAARGFARRDGGDLRRGPGAGRGRRSGAR